MREPTTEEILSKCPDVIPASSVKISGKGRQPIRLYKRTGGGRRKVRWFSEKDRIKVATVYAITGNSRRTSEITGVPDFTIRQWKRKEWWPEIIRRVQQEKDDELDVKFTKIIDSAVEQINDRILNGDYIYDNKKGELIRIPVKAKDAANVTATLIDKRTAIRNREVQRQTQESVNEKLVMIAEKFQELIRVTQGKKAKPDVVDAEVIEQSKNEAS